MIKIALFERIYNFTNSLSSTGRDELEPGSVSRFAAVEVILLYFEDNGRAR